MPGPAAAKTCHVNTPIINLSSCTCCRFDIYIYIYMYIVHRCFISMRFILISHVYCFISYDLRFVSFHCEFDDIVCNTCLKKIMKWSKSLLTFFGYLRNSLSFDWKRDLVWCSSSVMDCPGVKSWLEQCKNRASRPSQGAVNGGAISKWPHCWWDIKHKQQTNKSDWKKGKFLQDFP